jgi:formyl-CoA transferase
VGIHAFQGAAWTVARHVGHAQGNRHPSIAPYGAFRCADGIVQIACGNETMWRRLCAQFGLDPDDTDFDTNTSRVENVEALTAVLEHRFSNLDREQLLAQLDEAGIPAGRIRSVDEVYEWEQTRSQRLIVNVEHATLGMIELPGMALRTYEMSPAGELSESTRLDHGAPPLLNADGPAIRSWLQESSA